MKYLHQFVTTNLNVGGGIDDSQTTGIVLQSLNNIDATKPSVACLTWADPLDTSVAEWITYTSVNSTTNELRGVTRGAEGYSAKPHLNQAVIAFPLSKSHVNDLNTAVSAEHSTAGVHSVSAMISGGSVLDEDNMASNSATALATQQSIKAYVDNTTIPSDGWIAAGETWTYASADDPTYTFTISGVDLTTKYYPGMRVKLTQTTAKYFIITKVAFSTDTTITIYGGTDYDLANAAITSPYYSNSKVPAGFPLDPTKWTVEVTDTSGRSQASAVSGTWYNLGSVSITIPIGSWWTEYSVIILHDSSSQRQLRVTLSTANNSQSDADFTVAVSITGVYESVSAYKRKCLSLTSKTAYYLNTGCFVAGTPTIFNSNDVQKLIIRAVCAYL